jgi:hypothetical protein
MFHVNMSRELNHAVLLVGYDYDDDGIVLDYTKFMGKEWGDNGFCKLRARPDEGMLLCQIYGVYPIEK